MNEIALHILDIVQNSIRAGATKIFINIIEDVANHLLTIKIVDNGKGMPDETVATLKNPFVTSRTLRKVGLGIPFLNQLCIECEGDLIIESKVGVGTKVIATMQYDHIDRLPLGDMPSTMTTLILAKPDIDYVYEHKYNNESFIFDTQEIRRILEGAPIQDLEIIKWIGNYLKESVDEIRNNGI